MGKEQQKRHDDYDHCYGSSFEDVKIYEPNRK